MADGDAYFDALETRDPERRERELFARLPGHVAHAKANAPYFAEILADVDPEAVIDRAALAALPVTRKSDLIARQRETPPFGGLAGAPLEGIAHIYQSPGPIYEPDGDTGDYWRFARAFWAAGVRRGDIVHNSFSYHLTPAGMMMESAARAIGCPVIPGGVGNTEMQLAAIAHARASAYAGTPSFLKVLLDKAAETGVDISSLTKASVGGEALPPSLRRDIEGRGVSVLQSYATADLGLIAYESPAMEGMIADEGVIVEIVRPGSGAPVPEGEVGEVVVTALSPVYPLVRFATGDLSAVLQGVSPCGRTNMRVKGWMGRADQTTKVKGMFVHPGQVDQVLARHPEIVKIRLVVDRKGGKDVMTLRCEVAEPGEGLAAAIAETLRSVCTVRGQVALVEPGSLANDGKVIDDVRSYA